MKVKITPLAIVLIVLEVFLVFLALYYLCIENKGGMALAGLISLIAALINVLVLVVQQVIAGIKGINKKVLWAIEILIIIAGIIYVAVNGISIG
jgi:hypothetical protein